MVAQGLQAASAQLQARRTQAAQDATTLKAQQIGIAAKAQTAKPAAKPKAAKAAPAAKSTITPYLTGSDLLNTSQEVAGAENADTAVQQNYATAAANAIQKKGDIERGRVADVAGANNDAAARGIYQSGIRAGNVGMANTGAARAQEQNLSGLALTAAQAIAQRNQIGQQQKDYFSGLVQKSADNGMALPVNPYDNNAGNVQGAATLPRAAAAKAATKGAK